MRAELKEAREAWAKFTQEWELARDAENIAWQQKEDAWKTYRDLMDGEVAHAS